MSLLIQDQQAMCDRSYGIEWRRKRKGQEWCFGLRFQKSKIVELKVVICVIHCKLC